jgi:hypothetical protein
MSKPTKEYYEAKADLCQNLAIKQILEGNTGEGAKNLIRMVNALTEANLLNTKKGRDNEADELLRSDRP